MLTLALRLVVLSLLFGFLAACDPRTEEEASLQPAHETPLEETIRAVIEAEKSIHSVQVKERQISTQLESPPPANEGDVEESHTLRIQVGDNHYNQHKLALPPEFCEGAESTCLDGFSPFDETLFFNGEFYSRDSSGDRWVSELQSGCSDSENGSYCVGTGGFVEVIGESVDCPALESLYEFAPSDIYGFDFSRLSDVQRVSNGEGGDGLIHLRGAMSEPLWSFGLSPEVEAAYAECGIEPPDLEPDPEMPSWVMEYMPERIEGWAEIWIGPTTFHIDRIDQHLEYFKGDKLLQTDDRSSIFSLFNEATLPGPLPE